MKNKLIISTSMALFLGIASSSYALDQHFPKEEMSIEALTQQIKRDHLNAYNQNERKSSYIPIALYQKRWGIECLFKSLISHGFELEKSHIKKQQSFLMLVKIISIAFAICFAAGREYQKIKKIPYRKTVQTNLYSVFRYGLDFLKESLQEKNSTICLPFLRGKRDM